MKLRKMINDVITFLRVTSEQGLKLLLAVFVLNVCFVLLIGLSSLQSYDNFGKEIRNSKILHEVGNRDYPVSIKNGPMDYFSECLGVDIARNEGDISNFKNLMLGTHYVNGDGASRLCESMQKLDYPKDLVPVNATRYWHGYSVIMPTVFNWIGYDGFYVVFTILFLLWLILVFFTLDKIYIAMNICLILCLWLFTDHWFYTKSITHGFPFTVALYISLLAYKLSNRWPRYLLAGLSGAVVCFVDFMIVAPFFLCLTVAFLFLSIRTRVSYLRVFIECYLGWLAGFALTFVFKPVFLTLVDFNKIYFVEFLEAVLFRVGVTQHEGVSRAPLAWFHRLSEVRRLFSEYSDLDSSAILNLVYLGILIYLGFLFRKKKFNEIKIIALVSLTPILWFEMATNHAQIHAEIITGRWFFLIFLMPILAIFVSMKKVHNG